jgi:hypothetical protein
MSDAKSRLQDRLMRRYPGVTVGVGFNDHVARGCGTYRGWSLSFESNDPNVLIRHRLAPLQCHFGSSRGNSELAGVSWHTHGIIDQSERYGISYHIEEEPHDSAGRNRALTKTMQTRVMRMLKPFIRGTWKPQSA